MSDEIEVRVYYEDTDFSGLVYHASYLRFMERARTEWLRARGVENATLASLDGLTFVVRRLTLDYISPGRMDDLLTVTAKVVDLKGALIRFEQIVMRGETLLCRGEVEVVTLKGTRPVRPPKALLSFRPSQNPNRTR
jgi:acyl-CoA thioester hydrolase